MQSNSNAASTFYVDNIRLVGIGGGAPAAPVLLAPANGATNQPTSLTLRWNKSQSATGYRMQLATDSLFSAIVVNDSTLTDTSRAVSGLLSTTLYYWRANARNSFGTSAFSAFRGFSTIDNIAPTVAITSPAPSATVANTVNVSASASDNVAVVGVQFRLDGNILGAEDTTAPYSVPWNTLTAANGAHLLTAVARDAAGNVTTSTAVSVTVANTISTSDLWVYQESLAPGWINVSWGGTVTLNSTEQSLSPPNSIKCAMGSFGGLRLRSSNWGSNVLIDPSQYSKLEFSLFNTTPGLPLIISFSNEQGGSFPSVIYSSMPLNQWVTVSFPMSQLDPNNLPIQFLAMQSNSNAASTFYVDNIRLVGLQSIPSAPVLLTPANEAVPFAANETPSNFALAEGFPNPFNPTTTISIDLPEEAMASLKVYDILGREVATLLNGQTAAGTVQTTWNPGDLAGGVYFVRFEAVGVSSSNRFTKIRKVLFVK
jgi:hypothetical protein